jgi:hypothetical protein
MRIVVHGQKREQEMRRAAELAATNRVLIEQLAEEFRDRATILIATESAAEGVNLQFCSLLVNYDLPWSPQRIEQSGCANSDQAVTRKLGSGFTNSEMTFVSIRNPLTTERSVGIPPPSPDSIPSPAAETPARIARNSSAAGPTWIANPEVKRALYGSTHPPSGTHRFAVSPL